MLFRKIVGTIIIAPPNPAHDFCSHELA